MNLKHAHYVLTILEEGNITSAAKKLHISQPSMSQTLKAIEKDLGAPIFFRQNRVLRLTYAGKKYVEAVRDIHAINENLHRLIEEMKQEVRGLVRIGISTQRNISLMPQILPIFMEKFPLVRVELIEMPSKNLENLVETDKCDVAFITTMPKQNHIQYRLIENEQIVLMASRKTKFVRENPQSRMVELHEARDELFVNLTPEHSVRTIQERLCGLLHFEPKVLVETTSMEAAKMIAARSGAMMVCPYCHISGNIILDQLTKSYPLKCHGFERHFYFCCRKKIHLTRYMEELFLIAKKCCRDHIVPVAQ